MKVFVLATTMGDDLVFRLTAPGHPCSPPIIRQGEAKWVANNPYSVYGKTAMAHFGCTYDGLTLVVLQVTSGSDNALL